MVRACEDWPVPRSPSSPRGVRAAPARRKANLRRTGDLPKGWALVEALIRAGV